MLSEELNSIRRKSPNLFDGLACKIFVQSFYRCCIHLLSFLKIHSSIKPLFLFPIFLQNSSLFWLNLIDFQFIRQHFYGCVLRFHRKFLSIVLIVCQHQFFLAVAIVLFHYQVARRCLTSMKFCLFQYLLL